MTNATIFNGEDDNQPVEQPAVQPDGELFPALVGETQKYKTPEELAKAYANADQFIVTLKEENRKLREQAVHAKTIDEVLERMSTQSNASENDNPPVQAFTPENMQQLVEKTLDGREKVKARESNLLLADKLMKEQFGEKALQVFQERANSPEKVQILMQLAATDPRDFVSMFVGNKPTYSNQVDTGSLNTTSVASNVSSKDHIEGTKEWAAKVRKDNPTQYWSQDFQFKLQQTVTKNPTLYFGH